MEGWANDLRDKTQRLHSHALLRLGKDQHHVIGHQAGSAVGQERH